MVRPRERGAGPPTGRAGASLTEIEMLVELLRTAAARAPETIAVVCGDERVSYGELWRRVSELAAELTRRGVTDGKCAAIVLGNGPDFAAALFATAMAGGVAQPLAPSLETAELARWLADTDPVVVIASEAARSRCRAALDRADLGAALLTCSEHGSTELDGRSDSGTHNDTLIRWLNSGLDSVPAARDGRLQALLPGSSRALYLYTSGSEGLRKRVCRTQANLHHEAMGFVTSARLGPDDTVLCLVPLHHSYGLGNGLLAAIGAGARLVVLPPTADGRLDAPFAARCREVVDLAAAERARLLVAVAYQYDLLAELPRGQERDLVAVRLCISSGNRLPDDVYDRFLSRHGHPIRQLYGSTETGSIAANLAPDGRSQAGSVGTCLAGVSVRIVDERGADVPAGEVGTVLVESPVLPPGGYDGEPEATAAAFRGGAYRTGDRGRLDAAGVLHIVGRKQTFIDTGGYKVDPAQVEAVLRQHPAVREAVVLGVDAGALGQLVTAFVAARAGTSEADLDRFCRGQMAPYKVPRSYRLLDALPRTALGKISAEALRGLAGAGPAGDGPARGQADEALVLDVGGTFTLERLGWRRSQVGSPGPGEVEIEVLCAGLNFLDVLLALGEIPDDTDGARAGAPRLGCECVGRVIRTGPGVRGHAAGDRVVAVFPGMFASRVCVPEALVAPAPRGLGDELAAALPIAHVTAHHALLDVAELATGERVLVHAAAGGVGLAAIQVARARGAEVIATAGSEGKRAHLRELGIEHVLDSRSTAYAEAIRELTGGQGVDVVLNSLAGEHITASLGLLRDYGRFVELGKRDYYADARIGLRPFLRQIRLRLVDLRGMMFTRRDAVSRALRDVVRLAEEGTYRPHVDRVFAAGRAGAAFRHLVEARQIGKVVLDLSAAEEVADHAAGAGPRGELARALAACAGPDRRRLAEARLVQELAAVLKADPAAIDRRAPLRSIGLDSLTAILLRNRLSELLGAELPVTLLFEHADAIELAGALLARAVPGGDPAVVPRSPARGGPEVGEPIAIVGIGCRLPGGVASVEDYWQLLWDGVDAIAPVPPGRWAVTAPGDAPDPPPLPRWGGFLDRVDCFDAGFFGIPAREASAMDPQQRLLLEVSWEALEDAGLAPDSLAGSPTGVFVGISFSDYGARGLYTDLERVTPYSTTGGAFSIAAGRISYVLGLTGPSLAVDTACSSSLAAVHLACQSIRAGECSAALVGGVNLVLEPHAGVSLGRMEALAADGRCKPFDALADGIVRSEGCAVIALRPLSAALRDGDRIYGVVIGTASNQDGRTSSLTAPSGRGQEALLRRALAGAGVDPARVGYLEAHGTGTRLGDPIEVHAAGAVLGARDPASPLWIGSVKGNIGHTEACAGIAGLIKAVLALHHRVIPASLHFRRPNPHIDWARLPVRVSSARTSWDAPTGQRRIAGVSSFGFSGTNVHVLVEEAR